MYVCVCLAVTDRQLEQAIAEGARSLTDLRRIFGMTLECGRCTESARQFLKRAHELAETAATSEDAPSAPAPPGEIAPRASDEA